MRAFSFAAVVFCVFSLPAGARDQQFPYDAVVDEDGVYVRSGPGEKYYPTKRMSQGSPVRVHRHDPGGWYMISPPQGSFSWVPKQYVRVTGQGIGEISDEGVVAYVGTDFGNEASVWQRRLSVGQQVEILGEDRIEITSERGPEPMLKIKPPRREWRWIPGRAVIVGGGRRIQEPLSARNTRPPEPRASNGFLNARPRSQRPRSRTPQVTETRRSAVDTGRLNADRKRLRELDDRFRSIILQPTERWDFSGLENDYLQLQQNTAHPTLANQVKLRLPALARYKKTKTRYDDFIALTSATAQRDRELVRMGSGRNGGAPPPVAELLPTPGSATTTSGAVGGPIEAPSLPRPAPVIPGTATPKPGLPEPDASLPGSSVPDSDQPANGSTSAFPPRTGSGPVFDPPATTPPATTPVPPGMTRVPQKHPRFAGAGFVQRAGEPNVPKFVLLAPNGKILAYLEPIGGVDLTKQVGYAMGVEGDRFHSPRLKADYIKVRGLSPIRLKP